jgi:hypothetical protein
MAYEFTISKLRERIRDKWEFLSDEYQKEIPHIMDMFVELEKTSDENSAKAGRWIGWILKSLEIMDILNNEESRKLIKRDVSDGNI